MSDLKAVLSEKLDRLHDLYLINNDRKECAEFYTDDCKLFMAGMPDTVGKEAATKLYASFGNTLSTKINFVLQEFVDMGDMAIIIGCRTAYDKDGTQTSKSRNDLLFKQVDGEWKIHRSVNTYIK